MPRATRILIVVQSLDAGVPRHVLDVVEELAAENFELTIACPPGSFLWERLSGRAQVRLERFTRRREPHVSDLLWVLRLIPLVRRSDVVHAHSSKAAWLARAAASIAGRRSSCVVTPHAWSFWALSGRRRRTLIALERMAAHACAAIIAVSRFEQEEGLRLRVGRRDQYHLIHNGIDLDRWAVDRTPDPDLVLMVGRLAPQKRPELAVRALALARRRRPTTRLVMAGSGELEGALRRLAHELGVDDAVRLLGTRNDVPDLLARAGCLLVTSAYEGCSLAILEAMAAGVPVVAVRFGGVDELVEHAVTGLLCDNRPEDVAAALVQLCDDAEMANGMGDKARRRARQLYSRRRMAQSLARLYESLESPS
jgi:glycosyltransferase involved in cell wall biosynthesis